jgi:hypothetical protein
VEKNALEGPFHIDIQTPLKMVKLSIKKILFNGRFVHEARFLLADGLFTERIPNTCAGGEE